MAVEAEAPPVSRVGRVTLRPTVLRGVLALAERDLILIRRSIPDLAVRSLFQPFLFVLIFTYVYPKIGSSLVPGEGALGISTIVLPGLIGFSAMFCGIYAVGMPLAVDLGLTREIDDRALAPVSTFLIPIVRLASGSLQAVAAALVVPLMIGAVAVQSPDTAGWSPPLFALALVASGLCTASMGLAIAGVVPIASLPAVLTVIPMPLTFLGAGYYSWASLSAVPALKVLILLNPMTWVSESLRAAITPTVPHMNLGVAVLGTLAWAVGLGLLGTLGVAKRIANQEAVA